MKHKGFGRVAAATLALSTTAVMGTAAVAATITRFSSDLRDYDSAVSGPFDHASARLQLVDSEGGTTAVLHVRGVDPAAAGHTFGAHLHNGPCVGDGASLSLGHYNRDAHAGISPAEISSSSEVWLDVTIDPSGAGDSSTAVRFPVAGGERSVVFHASPTNPVTGAAGPRLACLPVVW